MKPIKFYLDNVDWMVTSTKCYNAMFVYKLTRFIIWIQNYFDMRWVSPSENIIFTKILLKKIDFLNLLVFVVLTDLFPFVNFVLCIFKKMGFKSIMV